jgi:hypothetical protein
MTTVSRVRRAAALGTGLLLGLQAPAVLASGEVVSPDPIAVEEAGDALAPPELTTGDEAESLPSAEPLPSVEALPPVDAIPSDLPQVAHATFTTEIADREPVDHITFVKNDLEKVFFFTDLRNLKGQTVTHQWEFDGDVISSVPFDVDGNRWRVWSSKEMKSELVGEWKASVLTEDGVVIETRNFTYSETPAAATLKVE